MGLVGTSIGVSCGGGRTSAKVSMLQIGASNAWIASVGFAAGSWSDAIGAASATQATGSKQPTLNSSDIRYNGQSTVSFASASSQDLVVSGFVSLAQPFTILLVGESSSGAAQQEPFGDLTNNTTGPYWNGSVWAMFGGSTLASANASRSPHIFAAVFNGASSALYIDSSQSPAVSGSAGASPLGLTCIGNQGQFSTSPLNGKIGLLAVVHSAMSPGSLRATFAQLGSLFGIPTS